jgi:hypothetical protein
MKLEGGLEGSEFTFRTRRAAGEDGVWISISTGTYVYAQLTQCKKEAESNEFL